MLDQLLSFFVSNAHADTAVAGAPQQSSNMSFIILMALMFGMMYFVIWRPQSKRAKEQRDLLSSVAKGDEVMTTGGLYGRVAKINEQNITLTIANNVDIMMQKSSIVSVLPKGTLKSME